ncbi:hypothetical protein [Mycobacterium riyadhense]|uniref:hypothetical protein n=1 Tax=Mycobacterium riyadhense TaxID=486698 RepID=UPI00195BE057|nr:hypothetical protein [Mycobacterium riyadhense]
MHTDKTLENRLRREAKRRGYLLRRSRSRNPHADDHGLYVLVNDSRGCLPGAQASFSAFARGEGMTLAGVEAELPTL